MQGLEGGCQYHFPEYGKYLLSPFLPKNPGSITGWITASDKIASFLNWDRIHC